MHGLARHAIDQPDLTPVGKLAFLRTHYGTRCKRECQETEAKYDSNCFHDFCSERRVVFKKVDVLR
jgi:hypothetical protein